MESTEVRLDSERASSGDDRALAYALLRVTLGLNIFMHGISRILAGPAVFAGTLDKMFQQTLLAGWPVHTFGLALPWIEAGLGLLLLLGMRARIALIGGAWLIAVLTFGTALRQDWATAGTQLIYAAIYAALLAFHGWDRYSIDILLSRNRNRS